MKILVPLCPLPGEFLAARSEEFMELGLRAVRTALDVAAACPGGADVLIAHQRLGETALARLPKAVTELVGLSPRAKAAEKLPFLPPGTSAALERITAPARLSPLAVVNLRNPYLEPEDLLGAMARFTGATEPLLCSAVAPRDHPCQGRSLYILDGPLRPLGDGANIKDDNTGPSVVLDRADAEVPEQALLVLMGHGEKLLLTDREPSAKRTHFRLPHGSRIPAKARWALALLQAAPGPGRLLLPHVPENGPWGMNPATGRITDAESRDIAGRQDFPPLVTPDGSFCLLAAPPPEDGETARLRHQIWELPPERSRLVTHPLALLAWRMGSKDSGKGLSGPRAAGP